jgi:hypothetical protein
MGSFLAYTGLGALAAGVASLIRPLRFLGIQRPRQGAIVAAIGAGVASLALIWPPSTERRERPVLLLDRVLPAFQFSERHERRVRATPNRIFEAIRSVTADDIAFFRTLTAIRNPGRLFGKQPEGILNPAHGSVLEAARLSGFVELAEEPGRELVIGTYIVRPPQGVRPSPESFAALALPGYAKAALNFRVEPGPDGTCRLTTETRVFATDGWTALRFAPYWRLIYPGSSLLRRTWLAAIALRAEAAR